MEKLIFIVLVNIFLYQNASGYVEIEDPLSLPNHALDQQLYKDVLDPELCQEHIEYMRNNNPILLAKFLDAGIRVPRGLLTGNLLDMGNYHQCLGIQEKVPDYVIEGKYCTIRIPIDQEIDLPSLPEFPELPDFPWPELNPDTRRISNELLKRRRNVRMLQTARDVNSDTLQMQDYDVAFNLAICIPKACTTREAIEGMMFNVTSIGLTYEDNFCRLPNDKPWVAADYIVLVVIGIILAVTVSSTAYDINYSIIQKNPKEMNKLLSSFSVYTNTRRLVTYTPVPGALECLDGVRVIAMLWVIVGHTFVTQFNDIMGNPLDALEWVTSFWALWITAAPITVDTFFMMSGLLVVYSTAGKLSRSKLLKNLHLFYLNRLLRMFPVLAVFVLIQASILNRIGDGPYWEIVADNTNHCRVYWWSTMLHIQNYLNPAHMCLPHTWYLAIDVQLHIFSPVILFWILGGKKSTAWIALTVAVMIGLVPSTIYIFYKQFPPAPLVPSRTEAQPEYIYYYYVNTMTRCAPFFVGMVYGYLLHLYRGKDVLISKVSVFILWLCALILSSTVIFATYPILQMDWDNQTVDSLINSFSRPAWALALGWLVFACVHGYGGPVNWLLSLRMWKVPSRMSYAMYISHYTTMAVINAMSVSPVQFHVFGFFLRFFSDLLLTVVMAFFLTVLVDSPSSTLIKHFLGGGPRRQQKPAIEDTVKNEPLNGRHNDAFVEDETKGEIKT